MPIPVIHDNDGHVDDILSSLLMWLSPEISLQAITVTDGDCYARQSFEALLKIATYLDLEGAEIGFSEDPCPNPFPDNWRRESYVVNELPIFGDNDLKVSYQAMRPRKSQALIADVLSNSREKVTLVCTGPLTNVARVFEEHPELKKNVEHCYVMGGAVSVPGNVEMPEHDGSAEWNFYADPLAARKFVKTGLPITLIPLDVTNNVPVTREFLLKLDMQTEKSRASQLAARLFSLVKGFNYYFWDTLTAACVLRPDLFTFKEQRLEVIGSGKSQGRSRRTIFGGKPVRLAGSVKIQQFEEVILEILRRR
jgi:purine nucleosidase